MNTEKLFNLSDKEKIPTHVAVIMDGNGRWAKQRGNKRIEGHRYALQAVRNTVEAAAETGVKFLTLYAFSKENWNRPKVEVNALMALFIEAVKNETDNLLKNNIRLKAVGFLDELPVKVQRNLSLVIEKTKNNSGLTLILALNYGSKQEIVHSFNKIYNLINDNSINIKDIDTDLISEYLFTSEFPDPDLLIRTGGEIRISNFLLWQLSYTELFFTDILWPDFSKEDFYRALADFQNRERRFGKISEQL